MLVRGKLHSGSVKAKTMKIALIGEGTYPHMQGGVSVWCEQLIAGLPEHQFSVYALTGQAIDAALDPMPANVCQLVNVALWNTKLIYAAAKPGPEFCAAYDGLLYSLFGLGRSEDTLLQALKGLFKYAQVHDLSSAMTSRRSAEQLYACWRRSLRQDGDHKCYGDLVLAPTLADALKANIWLEHLLRPLSCPPPKADLCHASSNGLSPLLGFTSKWAYGTPLVLTEHGLYLRERYLELRFSGHTPAFKSLLMRFYHLLCASAYKMADLITPGSQYNERWEVQQGAVPGRIHAIYNGVNPAFFPEAPQEPAVPTISWVGRVDPLKDLETLIRAFGTVRDAMPTAKLRMFGAIPKGNEKYAQSCQHLIEKLNLSAHATFEGRVTNVVDAYHAGHLVALTSISEGFPYTLIEAMAAGRATVSTDVGGVSEAVGETGLVVPSRDVAAVARASLSLLDNGPLRASLGHAARERVLSQFTLENFLGVYRQVYPRLLATHLAFRETV